MRQSCCQKAGGGARAEASGLGGARLQSEENVSLTFSRGGLFQSDRREGGGTRPITISLWGLLLPTSRPRVGGRDRRTSSSAQHGSPVAPISDPSQRLWLNGPSWRLCHRSEARQWGANPQPAQDPGPAPPSNPH